MLRRDVQMAVVHVVRGLVDGGDARNPTVCPSAERERGLVAGRGRQGVAEVGLDGGDVPAVHAEGLGHLIQDVRFRDPVLWRPGAVRVNVGSLPNGVFAEDCTTQGKRLGDSEVVADAGGRDGLLEAVGIDENVANGAVDVGAEF